VRYQSNQRAEAEEAMLETKQARAVAESMEKAYS
jgi:hypothetical protein